MILHEFNLETAKEVWQEEAREEGLIQTAVNAIKNWGFSLTNAMFLVGLDTKHRDRLIKELQKQEIEYTE